MNLRLTTLLVAGTLIVVGCTREPQPLVTHLLVDPNYESPWDAKTALGRAYRDFTATRPKLRNGREVTIAFVSLSEGDKPTFVEKLPERMRIIRPEIVVVGPQTDLSGERNLLASLGQPRTVCGDRAAYVTSWATTEDREAAGLFLDYLKTHCK